MSKRNRISKLQRAYLDQLELTVGFNIQTAPRDQTRNYRRMLKSLERQGLIRVQRTPPPPGAPNLGLVSSVTLLEP